VERAPLLALVRNSGSGHPLLMVMRDDPVLLDTILRPNPPMNSRALLFIFLFVAGLNVAFASMLVLRGAWPIAPFMGVDVVLLGWAFQASRMAARAFEHVRLTPSELSVVCHSQRGAERQLTFNPYWISVHLAEPEDMPRALTLRSHGKGVQIGKFLGPRDRRSFADALKAALNSAKSWRPSVMQSEHICH
jgi:uncharacterized membrane protein